MDSYADAGAGAGAGASAGAIAFASQTSLLAPTRRAAVGSGADALPRRDIVARECRWAKNVVDAGVGVDASGCFGHNWILFSKTASHVPRGVTHCFDLDAVVELKQPLLERVGSASSSTGLHLQLPQVYPPLQRPGVDAVHSCEASLDALSRSSWPQNYVGELRRGTTSGNYVGELRRGTTPGNYVGPPKGCDASNWLKVAKGCAIALMRAGALTVDADGSLQEMALFVRRGHHFARLANGGALGHEPQQLLGGEPLDGHAE
eukprot:1108909-Prorocentrum_minimum.AAC.2